MKKGSSRTRTITQHKVFEDFFVNAYVETDFSIDADTAPEKLEELGKKWAASRGSYKYGQYDSELAYWQEITFCQVANMNNYPVEKAFYENECYFKCEVVKENYHRFIVTEEHANQLLEKLLTNKLLFDGYVYKSKFGDVVLFGVANKLYVNGEVFIGEWK